MPGQVSGGLRESEAGLAFCWHTLGLAGHRLKPTGGHRPVQPCHWSWGRKRQVCLESIINMGDSIKNLFFIKLFLPEAQAAWAVCLFLVLIVIIKLGQGRDYTVPQGARVHLTRSSLEGDDTTWASCLFHHFVFWEHICKLFISCSRLLRTSTGQTMAPQPESVCVLSLLRLPTVNNKLCKYWLMWPG